MNLLELSKLLLDEKLAEQYLLEKGILKTFSKCEKCGATKLGRIRRGRIRCYSCKKEWSSRKGSILYYNNLSYSKYLGIIKMFELDISAIEASKQLDLHRNSINGVLEILRKILTNYSENIRGNYNSILEYSIPAFCIKLVDEEVSISVMLKSELPDSVFTMVRKRDPNNNITFYFDYKRIKFLLHNDEIEKFPTQADKFFRYLKKALLKYQGTKIQSLYLYLKEAEFRYNNRNEVNLFDIIINKLANFEGWSDSVQVSKNNKYFPKSDDQKMTKK